MRSGPVPPAAGRPTPGPSPSSASQIEFLPTHTRAIPNRPWRRQSCLRVPRTPRVAPSHNGLLCVTHHPAISNRPSRKTACRAGGHSPFHAPRTRLTAPTHTISNRHLVQLEFTATLAESTTSLFLIDPKQPHFSRTFTLSSLLPCTCIRPFPSTRGTFPSTPAYLHPTRQVPSGGF